MSPECHMNPDKRDGDEDLVKTHRGEGGAKTKTETGLMWPQAKGSWQPPEARRDEEMILPYFLCKEHSNALDLRLLPLHLVSTIFCHV